MQPRQPHVLHVLEPTYAGVPGYVRTLALELGAHGWATTVVCQPEASRYFQDTPATLIETPISRRPSLSDRSLVQRLETYCRRAGVSVVHSHATKAGLLGRSLARRLGCVSVYSPHSFAFERDLPAPVVWGLALAERRMTRTGHHVVLAVCLAEARAAQVRSVAEPRQIRVVHSGIGPVALPDRAGARLRLGIAPDARVACWVGRAAAQKRPQDLAPLAARLARRDVQLVVLGTGLPEAPDGRRAREQGALVLEGTPVTEVLAAADVFVQTSAWEGFSIAILEAMAAGLPVVAYGVGGAFEQVRDGENGYLVLPGDVDAMTARVAGLVEDPARLTRFGMLAREVQQTLFSAGRMAGEVAAVYRSALTSADVTWQPVAPVLGTVGEVNA